MNYKINSQNLRPKIFNSIKFWDQTKICLPGFTFVIFKEPERPPENKQYITHTWGIKENPV